MSLIRRFLILLSLSIVSFFGSRIVVHAQMPLDGGCIEVPFQWVVTNTSPQTIYAKPASAGACGGSYSYQWQMSYDDLYYTDIPGATSQDLNYSGSINQTTYFHRKTTCGNTVKYTNTIKVEDAAQVFYNTVQTQNFTRNNCPYPSHTEPFNYTVPAQKYSSPANINTANQMAIDELNTNGQWYANTMGVCCSLSMTWENGVSGVNQSFSLTDSTVYFTAPFGWPGGSSPIQIGTLDGDCIKPVSSRTIPFSTSTAVFEVVISPTGTVTVYLTSGTQAAGNISVKGYYNTKVAGFYNDYRSQSFTRNDCSPGYVGSSVSYPVPAYKYFSIISKPNANQLADNEIAANGQLNANTSGTCTKVNQITGSNNRAYSYGIQFVNEVTNVTYNTFVSAYTSNVPLVNLPSGTYTVRFMPTGGPPTQVNFTVAGVSQYYLVSATFNGIYINSNTSAYVH